MFVQYQQANREWANVALVGVQQAQVGMKQWYDFAASTQANVAHMLAGTEQRQAAVIEQAMRKANVKKWGTRFAIIGLVLVGMVSLFGCAFFALVHLYYPLRNAGYDVFQVGRATCFAIPCRDAYLAYHQPQAGGCPATSRSMLARMC